MNMHNSNTVTLGKSAADNPWFSRHADRLNYHTSEKKKIAYHSIN